MSKNKSFIIVCPDCGYKGEAYDKGTLWAVKCPKCWAPMTTMAELNRKIKREEEAARRGEAARQGEAGV